MGIISILSDEQKEWLYLDYINSFLTISAFSDHYMIDVDLAENFIDNMSKRFK